MCATSAAASQTAVVSANATAWEVNVSGTAANQTMTLRGASRRRSSRRLPASTSSRTASCRSTAATLDVQYVDIRDGGRLTGSGSIATGSGPIPGQVENVSGVVAPGNGVGILEHRRPLLQRADGDRWRSKSAALTAGTQYDRLAVDGPATLAGTLAVSLPARVRSCPRSGTRLPILTATDGIGGEFDVLNLPALPPAACGTSATTRPALLLK